MALNTKIEWTEATWNPVTGCTKLSAGCLNCYAERLAFRLQAMGNRRYNNGFDLTLHEDLVSLPLKWKKSKYIFVNSMSDLFHEDIPIEFIERVFKTMELAKWHTFQVLTKRSERLAKLAPKLSWPSNVWIGVTVESSTYLGRITDLQNVPAAIRFLSMEPLLSSISLFPTEGIDWVVVGGESGVKSRPVNEEWVRDIRDYCVKHKVPYFFKQWGGVRKKAAGRLLDGKVWDQLPRAKRK
jgi:protein gp37